MKYGIYNTDGDFLSGDLNNYSQLARDLDRGTVSLYLRIDGNSVIMGTTVNIFIERHDTQLFIAETDLNSFSIQSVREFFVNSVSELNKKGYKFENIAMDDELYEQIVNNDLILSSGNNNLSVSYEYIGGKLIANEYSYIVSSDYFNSISYLCSLINNIGSSILKLKPPITFVCSKMTFENTDFLILPRSVPGLKEDFNLDNAVLSPNKNIDNYRDIFKLSKTFEKEIHNFDSRNVLLEALIKKLYVNSKKDPEKRKEWRNFASDLNIKLDVSLSDAFYYAQKGDDSVLKQYLRSDQKEKSNLEQEANEFLGGDISLFNDLMNKSGKIIKTDPELKKALNTYFDRIATGIVQECLKSNYQKALKSYLNSNSYEYSNFAKAVTSLKSSDASEFIGRYRSVLKGKKELTDLIKRYLKITPEQAAKSFISGDDNYWDFEFYISSDDYYENKSVFKNKLQNYQLPDLLNAKKEAKSVLSKRRDVSSDINTIIQQKKQMIRRIKYSSNNGLYDYLPFIIIALIGICIIIGVLVFTGVSVDTSETNISSGNNTGENQSSVPMQTEMESDITSTPLTETQTIYAKGIDSEKTVTKAFISYEGQPGLLDFEEYPSNLSEQYRTGEEIIGTFGYYMISDSSSGLDSVELYIQNQDASTKDNKGSKYKICKISKDNEPQVLNTKDEAIKNIDYLVTNISINDGNLDGIYAVYLEN